MLSEFWDLLHRHAWVVTVLLALGILFGLFLRRRSLAQRATRAARGEDPDAPVTMPQYMRARIQFLMTLGVVVLLFVIWLLQKA